MTYSSPQGGRAESAAGRRKQTFRLINIFDDALKGTTPVLNRDSRCWRWTKRTITLKYLKRVKLIAATCTPGNWYYDGCNNCTCSTDGDFYSCTEMYCSGNPIQCVVGEPCLTIGKKKKCQVGQSYYDGCNWCHCSNGAYACTKIGCSSNPVIEINMIQPLLRIPICHI
ncbi:hypothetical protein HA402_001450 [Bradysia odoriphaga]|nr:hypothetical protein HA402_001450 [Bradysia odoriphaga]